MGVTRIRRKTVYRPEIDRVGWDGDSKCFQYRCPKCRTSFRILGEQEKFCHGCGRKLNWEGLPKIIDKDLWHKILDTCNGDEVLAELAMIQFVNTRLRGTEE
jgi:hypothetical protein